MRRARPRRSFDDILIPAAILATEENAENHISAEMLQYALNTISNQIKKLGERIQKPRLLRRPRILGVLPVGESHDLALTLLLELLRDAGTAVKLAEHDKSTAEIRELVRTFSPQVVCLSCTLDDCIPAALDLLQALKQEFPHLTVVAGGRAAAAQSTELISAGCTRVCESKEETRYVMRSLAVQWRRSQYVDRRATNSA